MTKKRKKVLLKQVKRFMPPLELLAAIGLVICCYGVMNGAKTVMAAIQVDTPVFIADASTPAPLRKILNIIPEDGENMALPVRQNTDVVFHGSRDTKEIALTFDADMTPWMLQQLQQGATPSLYDKRITDYLTATNTKATLFLTGLWIEAYHDDTVKLAANPLFELANHSYSHPSFDGFCYGLPQMGPDQNVQEVMKTQQLLFDITKKQNTLFRFPGGCYSKANLAQINSEKLKAIQWDDAGEDGFTTNTAMIENNVITHVQNGSIIVLHMNGSPTAPVTADALPAIVTRLKEEGYQFVTVSELMNQQSQPAKISLSSFLVLQNNF